MVLMHTPAAQTGFKAPDFTLPGVDGKTCSLEDVKDEKGTVVMFICNHCPYVKAIIDRIVRDAAALQDSGIGCVAIMSNDTVTYPEDSFDNMKAFAAQNGFTFPYLLDETQAIAKAYDAVCTPDFFGFNADLELVYRGRLDESGRNPAGPDVKRELYDAMKQVAETGQPPHEQVASMGCSIKWKDAA